MKDFESQNKLWSYEQYKVNDLQQQTNSNIDIQYLLTYINPKQYQPLNLTAIQSNQQNPTIIPNSALETYVINNSSRLKPQSEEKSNLVTIIDQGIRLVSVIKARMQNKKQDFQNKKWQNPYGFLKQFFQGKSQLNNHLNNNNYLNNKDYQRKQQTQIKRYRLEKQVQMLTAKIQQQNKQINNFSKFSKYQYLLSKSLSEQIEQNQLQIQNELKQQIQQIELKLNKLEKFHLKNQQNIESQSFLYEELISQIFKDLEKISSKIKKLKFKKINSKNK